MKHSKRKSLRVLGVVGAGAWTQPLVGSVVLPAHAAVSCNVSFCVDIDAQDNAPIGPWVCEFLVQGNIITANCNLDGDPASDSSVLDANGGFDLELSTNSNTGTITGNVVDCNQITGTAIGNSSDPFPFSSPATTGECDLMFGNPF